MKPDPYPKLRVDNLLDTRGSHAYFHAEAYKRGLASASTSRIKAEDCLYHSLWEISVFNEAIWSWSTSCVPTPNEHSIGSTWEDHLIHLDKVLSQLKKAGLTVKARNCQLGYQECQFGPCHC